MTTQRLPEAVSPSKRESDSANLSPDARQRGSNLVLVGFIAILAGAALGIIGKKLMHNEVAAVIGVLISLAGMLLMVYPYLVPPRRRKHDSAGSSQPEQLTEPQPVKTLPQDRTIDYMPSITERTTDLLKNEPRATPETKADRESRA